METKLTADRRRSCRALLCSLNLRTTNQLQIMSDSIFNLRILDWHIKIKRSLCPEISRNHYHRENAWPDGKWKLYQVGGWHSA
jgi:hypothetical protein